ncbi:MAG: histidine--tRNA ligase [Chlamydiota bacterium]
MSISIPKGTFDILPHHLLDKEEWRASEIWNYLESQMRQIAREYGFKEIRTPIIERTELFQRGVGETSDIVSKEMYTFLDKGQRSLTLRPEGTACVMRSFLEKNLNNKSPYHKLFYIGPMFRYERQQAGRYRQHHQFGVEAIGSAAPESDAECIALLYTLLKRLGLSHITLHLNSVGDTASRQHYREALREYLKPHFSELSAESKERFDKNPLRILDSKAPQDREILKDAPSILEYLDEDSHSHFQRVCQALELLKIPYCLNNRLVRGLDYYSRTVFEITSSELGAQNSLGGGGRYDGLIKSLGGPDLPAFGFGTGIERVIQTMLSQKVEIPADFRPQLYIIPLGESARQQCFSLLQNLRLRHIAAEMDYSDKKLKQSMRYANNIRAQYCLIIGDNEIATNAAQLKNMDSGNSHQIPFNLESILQEIQ